MSTNFRRLKWNELVSTGDFVLRKSQEFEAWDGPTGFQADSFVQPIYRLNKKRTASTKKSKNTKFPQGATTSPIGGAFSIIE